jgi:hypothetical protein
MIVQLKNFHYSFPNCSSLKSFFYRHTFDVLCVRAMQAADTNANSKPHDRVPMDSRYALDCADTRTLRQRLIIAVCFSLLRMLAIYALPIGNTVLQ